MINKFMEYCKAIFFLKFVKWRKRKLMAEGRISDLLYTKDDEEKFMRICLDLENTMFENINPKTLILVK